MQGKHFYHPSVGSSQSCHPFRDPVVGDLVRRELALLVRPLDTRRVALVLVRATVVEPTVLAAVDLFLPVLPPEEPSSSYLGFRHHA
jgi:hypothetical protein